MEYQPQSSPRQPISVGVLGATSAAGGSILNAELMIARGMIA